MKIQIMSDLHLEFKPKNFPLISSEAEAIIIAGDLATDEADFANFLMNYVRDFTDAPVLFVLGNHDYYGKILTEAPNHYKDMASSVENVHVLDNQCVNIKGIKFVGTTLWTDFDNRSCMAAAMTCMPDYDRIKKLGHHYEAATINAQDIYETYQGNLEFLDQELGSGLRTVVVTHHIPSYKFVDPYFLSSSLNGAFYCNLDNFIEDKAPYAWICGHTHRHFTGKIGETFVYCNPYGYPYEGFKYYKEEFLVEV